MSKVRSLPSQSAWPGWEHMWEEVRVEGGLHWVKRPGVFSQAGALSWRLCRFYRRGWTGEGKTGLFVSWATAHSHLLDTLEIAVLRLLLTEHQVLQAPYLPSSLDGLRGSTPRSIFLNVGKCSHWPLLVLSVFPGGSVVKNLPANAGDKGDVGQSLGSGRSPGEGNGYPLSILA